MAIKSYPYLSIDGDRKITATNEADKTNMIIDDGIVFDEQTSLKITKVPDTMNVKVAPGKAFIKGRSIISDETEIITIEQSDSSKPRIDVIALECNTNTNTRAASIRYIKGTADDNPMETELSTELGIYQIKLAKIEVPASAVTLNEAKLTDIRTKCIGKHDHKEIRDSFNADIDAYYGNTKLIDDFQDATLYPAVSGMSISNNSTKFKLGKSSIKFETAVDTIGYKLLKKENLSLDLTKLNNGETSNDDDYIMGAFYLEELGWFNGGIELSLASSSIYSGENRMLVNITPVVGWNFFKIKKSSFYVIGTVTWDSIKSIALTIQVIAGNVGKSISFQLLQLVKKDPLEDYPNPFQRFGNREFAIIDGEWVVCEEFGKLVIKEIGGAATTKNALQHTSIYNDFIINLAGYTTASNISINGAWFIDANNYINFIVSSDILTLKLVEDGVAKSHSVSFDANENEKSTFKLVKRGNKINLYGKSGNSNNGIILDTTTSLNNYGKFEIGKIGFNVISTILSASITEISHAHHADVAEVAKSLAEQARAKVVKTESQILQNAIWEPVIFDSIIYDNRNFFDVNTSNVMVIPETGWYSLKAYVRFANSTAGVRMIKIATSNTTDYAKSNCTPMSTYTILAVSTSGYFEAGERLQVQAFQNSGSTLALEPGAEANNQYVFFLVEKIGG